MPAPPPDAPVSAIARFFLLQPDDRSLALAFDVDFSPTGLNANQTAIGDHVNAIQLAGGSLAFDPVIEALFAIPDVATLADAYDQISPEPYLDQMIVAEQASQSFTEQMFSCVGHDGRVQAGDGESCAWGRIVGRLYEFDRNPANLAFDEQAVLATMGGEFAVGNGWRIGGAIGYEDSTLELSDRTRSRGERFHVGLSVKNLSDWADIALAVSGGSGSYDTVRRIAAPVPAIASSETDMEFATAGLRVSRLFESGHWWARPSIDLAGSVVHFDAFNETGAGPLNLQVAAREETSIRLRPALELGTDIQAGHGAVLRPTVRIGAAEQWSGQTR